MAKDAHNKAAEQHENAAKAHRMAAEHHGKGDHAAGKKHSATALEHSGKAHELCPPSSSKRNLRLTRSPARASIWVASSAMPSRIRLRTIGMFRKASVLTP